MLKNSGPLVSICIPAYNCDKYVAETLSCLCSQTYRNIEIIVVNDGSTDQTLKEAKKINDTRISVIDVSNGGAAKTRNIAYSQAKGDYIIFFDADDLVGQDFVEMQMKKIDGRDNIIVLSSWGRFYHHDINSFRQESIPYDEMHLEDWINYYWYNSNPMTTPGRAIIPKTLIEKAGLWNENLSLNDDLEFFTRLFLNSKRIVINHDAIFYYRSGIKGLSAKNGPEANLSLYNSVTLATDLILKNSANKPSIRQSCANLLQGLVYELYPEGREFVKNAENKIKELGGSTVPFPSGGYTKFLASVIGWKPTKIIKKYFQNISRSA